MCAQYDSRRSLDGAAHGTADHAAGPEPAQIAKRIRLGYALAHNFSGWFVVTRFSVTHDLRIWDVKALRFGGGGLILLPVLTLLGADAGTAIIALLPGIVAALAVPVLGEIPSRISAMAIGAIAVGVLLAARPAPSRRPI